MSFHRTTIGTSSTAPNVTDGRERIEGISAPAADVATHSSPIMNSFAEPIEFIRDEPVSFVRNCLGISAIDTK